MGTSFYLRQCFSIFGAKVPSPWYTHREPLEGVPPRQPQICLLRDRGYRVFEFWIYQLGRVKRIWYLSPMRAAKVQANLRSLARTSAAPVADPEGVRGVQTNPLLSLNYFHLEFQEKLVRLHKSNPAQLIRTPDPKILDPALCSLIQALSREEPSDRKPDSWPLWMAGRAQLKFVMTECSKTQIRLTGLNYVCYTVRQRITKTFIKAKQSR